MMVDPVKVVTNPSTNRARRGSTLLMWLLLLALRQTAELRHRSTAWYYSLAAHPSKGGLQTVYDHLQVPSQRGPIVPYGDVLTSF